MLKINNISFSYAETPTLKNIDFEVLEGQNIAVLGESGCGKSTLLKLIYGLFDLNQGSIFFQNKEVLGPKFNLIPGVSEMKYLAQDFDLMPFITVAENVGKFLSNSNFVEKQNRIAELLETVEMTNFAHTKAQFLSGGQMQRVAIARVLALEPKLLLLDEPFSHIDNFRKNALRRNLFAYLKNKNISCIVATHDCVDALSFADETVVIKDGQLIQKDVSKTVYENPKNRYVGSLFGEVNEIDKAVFDTEDHVLCYPHQLVVCTDSKLKVHTRKSYFKGTHFLIKAVQDKNVVFFEHKTEIKFNETIFLDLKK